MSFCMFVVSILCHTFCIKGIMTIATMIGCMMKQQYCEDARHARDN